MKKMVGYVVSIAGLIVMALGFGVFKIDVGILNSVSASYITIAGVIAIVIGVVLSLRGEDSSKDKQTKEEVPIYEGKGKKRKIVGYQRG